MAEAAAGWSSRRLLHYGIDPFILLVSCMGMEQCQLTARPSMSWNVCLTVRTMQHVLMLLLVVGRAARRIPSSLESVCPLVS
jgi:hypothetical protein